MRLTDDTITRLGLVPVDTDFMDIWSYKVQGSGEGSCGLFIANYFTQPPMEPLPGDRCWVYEIKKVQQPGKPWPTKVCRYFFASIEFINDTELEILKAIINKNPWPEI